VLADFTGLKMIMLPGVYGNATIAVTDRPWDEVFAYLISKYNLTWRRSHDVIYIGKEWDFK
jgi:type II secretory pathway component HofQ